MLLIAGMSDRVPLTEVGAYARRVEALGFDVLHVPETVHDSMAVSLLALMSTERLRVQTSLTLAFPRSPMLLAIQAWDASAAGGGRFDLGLATQIRQNIEGRFGVAWTDPLRRMEDYVTVVRAIWKSFTDGSPLNVRTDSYKLDRLQPFFNPGPLPHDPPTILLGGVNRGAIELAGRCADWFVTHPTNSHPRFVRELAMPALESGIESARRGTSPRIITASPLITGPTSAEVDRSREAQRAVLAFLYSTPAYQRSLELFGWPELGPRLRTMTRNGDWGSLGSLMTDEVLDTVLPTGTWDELPAILERWYSGLVDGLLIQPPDDPALDERFGETLRAIGSIRPRLG